MMAESLESRKFERKTLFDVPLPVRPKNREPSASMVQGSMAQEAESPAPGSNNKMAFSLLTKKGNRQQVCYSFDLSVIFTANTCCRLEP